MLYDETKRRVIPEIGSNANTVTEENKVAMLEAAVNRRDREIGTLVRLLEDGRQTNGIRPRLNSIDPAASQNLAEQFNRVIRAMLSTLARWVGRSLAQRIVVASLVRSGAFDASWYLNHYPDVRASGQDPLRHYLRHGVNEGRAASPVFQFSSAN